VQRIARSARARKIVARDAPRNVRNQTALVVDAFSSGSGEDPIRIAARLPALIPRLLTNIQNAVPDAREQPTPPPPLVGEERILHISASFMSSLIGDGCETHELPVGVILNLSRDGQGPAAMLSGQSLHALLNREDRQELAGPAQRLVSTWVGAQTSGIRDALAQLSEPRTSATTASDLRPRLGTWNPANAGLPQGFPGPRLNQQGVPVLLKPVILDWLDAYLSAMQCAEARANPATFIQRREESDAYLAKLGTALDGTLQDVLKEPALVRLFNALQDATRKPQRYHDQEVADQWPALP